VVTGGGFHTLREDGPRIEAHLHFRGREDDLVDAESHRLLVLLRRRVLPDLLRGRKGFALSGRDLENWGIEPDVRVDSIPEEAKRGEDRQFEKAVEVLLAELE